MPKRVESALQRSHANRFGQIAWTQPVLQAVSCSHANRRTAVRAGQHHTRRPKGHVGGTDDAPRQKQVIDIAAVVAAIRNTKDTFTMPLVTRRPLTVNRIGGMQIQRPSTHSDCVRVDRLFDDILLAHHVVAFETATLPFTGNRADPFERHRFRLWKLAGILDVIPDAIDHFP